MGKLEELEEELYGKEAAAGASRVPRHPVFPSVGHALRTSWDAENPRPGMLSRMPFSKMTAIAILAGVLFVAGAGIFAFLYLGSDRREAAVVIEGRDDVEAGERAGIPVIVRNVSSEPLYEADLMMTFPSDVLVQDGSGQFVPVSSRLVRRIGTLEPGEEQRIEFTAQFFGREGDEKVIGASLAYRPGALRARFSSAAEKNVRIARVPLAIAWDIPAHVSPGLEVPVAVRYSSHARLPLDDLWLRLDYPPGFTVKETVPAASSTEALWRVGTLSPGAEQRVLLKAVFGNAGGDMQSLRAGLGTYDERTKEWKPWLESSREITLAASPFLLEGTIEGAREGIVKPGALLSLAVRYRNRSGVPVKNITVRAALAGDVVDFSTLSIGDGGVFDGAEKRIVWGPGGTDILREVLPGAEGVVHLSARARPRPMVRSAADKNLTVGLTTHIETASTPSELEGSVLSPDDSVVFKVSTVVLVSGRSVFRTSPIPNTGPLPPKVGEKTTYTIVWEARNFTNEIEGAELRASLPPNVRWEGVVSPRDADIRFDAPSGEVRWRIGRILPGTGVLTPGRIGAFQVSLIPSEVDVGTSPALVGDAHFSGRDMFTDEEIKIEMRGVDTQLSEDPLVTGAERTVVR
ncbi:MAG: hypothetical protein AAB533_03950 [Patescibacteria group bacterium]